MNTSCMCSCEVLRCFERSSSCTTFRNRTEKSSFCCWKVKRGITCDKTNTQIKKKGGTVSTLTYLTASGVSKRLIERMQQLEILSEFHNAHFAHLNTTRQTAYNSWSLKLI